MRRFHACFDNESPLEVCLVVLIEHAPNTQTALCRGNCCSLHAVPRTSGRGNGGQPGPPFPLEAVKGITSVYGMPTNGVRYAATHANACSLESSTPFGKAHIILPPPRPQVASLPPYSSVTCAQRAYELLRIATHPRPRPHPLQVIKLSGSNVDHHIDWPIPHSLHPHKACSSSRRLSFEFFAPVVFRASPLRFFLTPKLPVPVSPSFWGYPHHPRHSPRTSHNCSALSVPPVLWRNKGNSEKQLK